MFTALARKLVFPLYNQLANEIVTDNTDPFCDVPEFPEDSDEKITVLFRLSLNEFVALSSAIDVGSDVAFGDDAVKIWKLWVTAYMCAQFCDEVALCFENEQSALMIAVAAALQNNPLLLAAISGSISNLGSGVPGQPLTTTQAGSNFLPENVKVDDVCDNNALWGACLYLVQSGNRAITDFFEDIEAASNTLETSAIVAEAVPAAGGFASAAAQFADQLQENLTEGYAAAYTEDYEEQLACAIFCAAQIGCSLDMNTLVEIMNQRLPSPADATNFGLVMARIGTGTFSGAEIADAAFYIYFTALKFGQQFGTVVGIRPLTDLMSLGADQLASDNWSVLCDCPEFWCVSLDSSNGLDTVFAAISGSFGPQAQWSGTGWQCVPGAAQSRISILAADLGGTFDITSVILVMSVLVNNGDTNAIALYKYDGSYTLITQEAAALETSLDANQPLAGLAFDVVCDAAVGGAAVPGEIIEVRISGTGTAPTIGVPCA
jgi:hypothetical protein